MSKKSKDAKNAKNAKNANKAKKNKKHKADAQARQIAEERGQMVARLHRSYLNLVNEMAALQSAWDAGGQSAFERAARDGWQLGAAWRAAGAAVFDAAFWDGIGPIDTVLQDSGAASAHVAERLVNMRHAILSFPFVVASGEEAAIRGHIDAVMRGFDADFADEILGHEDFALILEVIRHDDSVLSFMAYVGLMMAAVPPNFYAFVAGKGAPCLMLEAVLLAVGTLLSGGSAAALRIRQLEERFDELDPDQTRAGAALNIGAAADALVRMLQDFRRAADDVHQLCVAIPAARRAAAGSGTSISARMAAIVADTSCRDCGSKKHTTTLSRMGTVNYE